MNIEAFFSGFEKCAAEYQGKKVPLGKPMRGDVKKYKVYVKDGDKVKKVNFGDKKMKNNRNNPKNRKNFRARHNCKDKKDRTTPGYWACKTWSKKPVSKMMKKKSMLESVEKIAEEIRRRVEVIVMKDDNVLTGKMPNGITILPGGGLDGDTVLNAAEKETMEETGYKPKNLKKIEVPELKYTLRESVRGKNKGQKQVTEFVVGEVDKKDKSLYNNDCDGLTPEFKKIDELIEELENSKGQFSNSQKQRAKVLKEVKDMLEL